MDGGFVIDKPAGMTSHDVVDEVRRKLSTKRVGHGGTLDPDATGILLIGVGKATRFLSFAQESPKRYEAVIAFGRSTSTQDASGETIEERPTDGLTIDAVVNESKAFVGNIEQIPPMVSAVKIGGERLHNIARRGETVERPPRPVTIYEINLLSHGFPEEPVVTLDVRCSSGTFIRTLAHDLGAAVGTGAHLRTLRRTEAGGFNLADAIPLDAVGAEHLRPMTDVVRVLPQMEVDVEVAALVRNGRPLDAPPDALPVTDHVAVVFDGQLLGVYHSEGRRLVAERIVPA